MGSLKGGILFLSKMDKRGRYPVQIAFTAASKREIDVFIALQC